MNDDATKAQFEHWALVELMGHQRIAGLVTEQTIAGKCFIRVDVPKANGEIAFTRWFGPDAIYAISPTDRQIAIALALAGARPVSVYDLAKLGADKKIGEGDEDPYE
jgi:hypothetical protein